jgi:hypothetical protein
MVIYSPCGTILVKIFAFMPIFAFYANICILCQYWHNEGTIFSGFRVMVNSLKTLGPNLMQQLLRCIMPLAILVIS